MNVIKNTIVNGEPERATAHALRMQNYKAIALTAIFCEQLNKNDLNEKLNCIKNVRISSNLYQTVECKTKYYKGATAAAPAKTNIFIPPQT